jgi:hypothetical protein
MSMSDQAARQGLQGVWLPRSGDIVLRSFFTLVVPGSIIS